MCKKLIYSASFIMLLIAVGSVQALEITTADGNGADTYLSNDGQGGDYGPDSMHGADTSLRAFRQLANVRSKAGYIRFDLSDVAGDMSDATLTFEATWLKGSAKGVDVYGLIDGDGDSWDESTITYNTAPGVIPNPPTTLGNYALDMAKVTLLGTITTPARPDPEVYPVSFSSNPTDLPLTSFLGADTNKLVTFLFIGTDNEGEIASKEHETFNPPTLTLPNAGIGLPSSAYNPNPADKEPDACRKTVLSWTPGVYAPEVDGHRIFFSEDFNEVSQGLPAALQTDPVEGTPQDSNMYPTTGTLDLDFGTTYYWRVDEANSTTGWDEGDVWQFTTEPFSYPIEVNNITATASSEWDADRAAENTVDESGLDVNDGHSVEDSDMWLSATEPTGAQIEYEFDKVCKLHQMWVWNFNDEFNYNFGIKDVSIAYSINGTDWTPLGSYEFARATGKVGYVHDDYSNSPSGNNEIDLSGVIAKYVRLTATSTWGGGELYGLSEVRFYYMPVRARVPSPEHEEPDVDLDVVLNFRAGREAAEHKLYLSTNEQAVKEGTISPISIPANGCETSYNPPGSLDLDQSYYWRVDEVNMAEDPNTWQGDTWNFTTLEYLVVDNMESYNDLLPDDPDSNRINYTWKDGFGYGTAEYPPIVCGNGTGSLIGHESEPHAETTIVHGGGQSLPYYYVNDGSGWNNCGQQINVYYSEAELTFDEPQDWDKAGIKTLTLYFYGDPNNDANTTEQMYVKVNGAKVLYDGDMNDIKEPSWHEWNIALTEFTGVDPMNITSLVIGFGDEGNTTTPGGSGLVYFDDIQLYPSRCVLSKRSADFAKADYAPAGNPAGDCAVNYQEVELMADDWLFGTVPSTAEEIWREAESANTMSAPMQVWSDRADASGGQYIAVEPGNTSGDNPPTEGVATYDFTVNGGTYKILGRVIAPTGNDDSFWCRIEGATTQTTNHESGWIWWDIAEGSSWHWDEVNSDNDNDQTVQFTMDAGVYTLEVAYREDGTLLDRLLITDDLNLNQANLPPRAADVSVDDKVDFEDFAILAEQWLNEQFWP